MPLFFVWTSMAKKQKSNQVTRSEAVRAVERLEQAVNAWYDNDDPDLLVPHGMGMRKSLHTAKDLDDAIADLAELCETTEVERDAWPIVLAAELFCDQVFAYVERYAQDTTHTDPGGSPQMWRAYDDLVASKTPPLNKLPEPIKQLLSEGVGRQQMAKMYGWYTPDGSPDVNKLQEEIDKPGTHFKPDKWEHPSYRKYWRDIAEQWERRCEDFVREAAEQAAEVERKAEPSPESLQELLALPNMTVSQIAKMKKITEDEVRAVADELGIALDSQTVSGNYLEAQRERERHKQTAMERQRYLETLNSYPELGDAIDERVEWMAADGLSAKDIADLLSKEFPQLDVLKIVKTVREVTQSANRTQPTSEQSVGATSGAGSIENGKG